MWLPRNSKYYNTSYIIFCFYIFHFYIYLLTHTKLYITYIKVQLRQNVYLRNSDYLAKADSIRFAAIIIATLLVTVATNYQTYISNLKSYPSWLRALNIFQVTNLLLQQFYQHTIQLYPYSLTTTQKFLFSSNSSCNGRGQREVNIFSHTLLSNTHYELFHILIQPLYWTKITQSFLYTTCVIKSFDICEYRLTSFFSCLKMPPMDRFFLENGEKTFAPSIVAGFTWAEKSLFKL